MSTTNNIDNDAFRHFFDVEQPWLPGEQMPSIDLNRNGTQGFWDSFITGALHSASALDNVSFEAIKQEDASDAEILNSSSIRTRLVDEGGHEAIEILDSDDDTSQFDFDLFPSADDPSPLSPAHANSTEILLDGFDDTSTAVDSEFDGDMAWSDDEMGIEDITEMELIEPVGEACKVELVVDGTEEPTWKPSNTTWLDPDVTSEVLEVRTKINRVLTVDRLERVHGIPSYWPVPRTKTAYLLDLNDGKYRTPGKVLSPDGLIKNKCQDSLQGGTGQNDSKAKVFIFGEEPVECRRSRLSCGGVYVCEKLDPTLLATERYELDVSSLETVVQAQVQSRVQENDSIEKNAILFWHVIHARPCRAIDSNDAPCTGRPIMKKFTEMRSGPHQHFIACSDWSPTFRKGHASFTIPANVDGPSLAKLFESGRLEGISDVPTCSRIISARIGRKAGNCKYPHNADGHASTIKLHKCSASMTIFVPCDSTRRLACVIIGENPHNHPVLPASKVSAEVEEMYRKCITAVGVAGATVTSIEKAPSTSVLLNGKSPALFHPALNSRAQQRKFLLREKQKLFPCGNGMEGVRVLFKEDAKMPADCRYIHRVTSTSSGGMLVYTFVPRLLNLIHVVTAFQVDGTFKRVEGEMDEMEFTVWHAATHRAVTIGRVYSDLKDRQHYKELFDGFRDITRDLTGKSVRFKCLTRGGNLLAMGTDMELAEILAAGDSFAVTNEPEYSHINTDDGEEIVKYFLRVCSTHTQRGILNLEHEVDEEGFRRIRNFPYLKNEAEISVFDTWIKTQSKKVNDWWKHKTQNPCIMAGIVQCRSRMLPEHWAITQATTNINEGQHHWTNLHTGTKRPLAEAIVLARKLDEQVADEIDETLRTGILRNSGNTELHRMTQNVRRRATASQKRLDTQSHQDEESRLKARLQELKESKGQHSVRKPRAKRSSKAESSSSGRVGATRAASSSARDSAAPYPCIDIPRTNSHTAANYSNGHLSNTTQSFPASSGYGPGDLDHYSTGSFYGVPYQLPAIPQGNLFDFNTFNGSSMPFNPFDESAFQPYSGLDPN